MGRLYVTTQEVHDAADAAALAAAGALQFAPGTAASATPARAQQIAALNRTAGQPGSVAAADITPLFYDPTPNTTVGASYPTANALQVTARQPTVYAIAGALGLVPPVVQRTATAWIANQNAGQCARPTVPSYTRMYETVLGLTSRPYSSTNTNAPPFTQAQVAALSVSAGSTAQSRTIAVLPPWQSAAHYDSLHVPNAGTWTPANWSGLGYLGPSYMYNIFTYNIAFTPGSSGCSTAYAQVGSSITPMTGYTTSNLLSASTQGYEFLCYRYGGTNAACHDSAGTFGVATRAAFADAGIVRMVTPLRVMCYFENATDQCAGATIRDPSGNPMSWSPPATTGYPPGTVLLLIDAPVFAPLTSPGGYPDVVLGDSISFAQRLLLVR